MTRNLPVLVLLLALPCSLSLLSRPLHAKEAPAGWKAQARAGVEAWDAGRAEEAERTLKAAVAETEKIKTLPPDADLALAHQILSHICETRGKKAKKGTKQDKAKAKAEADRHFQKARDILDRIWAAGAAEKAIQPFQARATDLGTKYRYAEQASLRRLILEVVEVRAPGTTLHAQAYDDRISPAMELGQFLAAESLQRRLITLGEKLRNTQAVDSTRSNLALVYSLGGRCREAVDLYQRVLKDLGPDADPTALSITRSNCAKALVKLGDESGAEAMLQSALPLLEKEAQRELDEEARLKKKGSQYFRKRFAVLLTTWGDLRRGQGRFEEAKGLYERAKNAAYTTDVDLSQAALSQVQGRLQEAEQVARRSVKILEQCLGADHFRTASARTTLASICFAEGKNKEAEALLRQALKVQEDVLGPQHPDAAETADILGTLLYAQAKYPEAEILFDTALEGRMEAFGEDHPLVSETLAHQGDLYMDMGKPKDAEAPYRKALALDEKRLGENHPGVGLQCRCLGQCLLALGRVKEAEPFLGRALRIDEAAFGADHPALGQDLGALAKLFKAKGDSGKQAEMSQRLETGRAKTAAEPLKPTAPAEPLLEVPATPEGLQGALRRGLGFLDEARGATALDFDTKRRAYTDAEVAFRQAMKSLEAMKAAGNAPADADEQGAQIRSFLFECHKCKPMAALGGGK